MSMNSYIGALVEAALGLPDTTDSAGFDALSMTEVGEITEWGEMGDTSEDVTETTLKGRTNHANGALDGGAIDFTFLTTGPDAGQEILRTASGTNDDVSFRITDPDGEVVCVFGKVANVRDRARTASTAKGMTGQLRVNSPTIRTGGV